MTTTTTAVEPRGYHGSILERIERTRHDVARIQRQLIELETLARDAARLVEQLEAHRP